MLIFIEETGANRRTFCEEAAIGQPARSHKLLCRGQHISAIAAMSAKGMLDCKIVMNQSTVISFMILYFQT